MADNFKGSSDVDDPATRAFAVTPHDANELTEVTRAIWVGGDGNMVCRFVNSSADVTITAAKGGSLLPFRLSHVRATGTTATALVGLA